MKKEELSHDLFLSHPTTPQLRLAAKSWVGTNKDMPAKQAESILTRLIKSPSDLEKCMAGILLGYMKTQRPLLSPFLYDEWLEYSTGWAPTDAICYNNFTAGEMLVNRTAWKSILWQLAKSENINKRRGALVLLTKPVRQSDEKFLSDLAFRIIDRLKKERDPLITKAISWLLRCLTKNHRRESQDFLRKNKDELPKVAIRETRNKLSHGRKSKASDQKKPSTHDLPDLR